MSKNLMIVESPAKARTISKFLGSDFVVMASMGHVRDLPKAKLGIDVEHKFEPTYVIPPKATDVIAKLKQQLKLASAVYLATDLDREGEAIAWHLEQVLKPKVKTERITFHEISRSAIEDAIKHSRGIDERLVEAQVARRELDRLVGYTLSPFLWKKVAARLSAGRVQSVAVRLVVEREREIRAFKSIEYWSLQAELQKPGVEPKFMAQLIAIDGKVLEKTSLNETTAKKLENNLQKAAFIVKTVDKKEVTRTPAPPFTTSTLQQDANRKLGFSAKRTMTLAQHLYEEGFITYMRTDSLQISKDAVGQIRGLIQENYGAEYVPEKSRTFINRSKGAQEAHEAIRPVKMSVTTDQVKAELDVGHARLYELIWKRALASQMKEAKFERTAVDIEAEKALFRANGQVPIFLGFLKVYFDSEDELDKVEEGLLPELVIADALKLLHLAAEQHFTEPPPRYTEATLVKMMEEMGIGRPSTYAPTISVIQDRGYVTLEDKKFAPLEIGELVTDLLVEHFPDVVDLEFTADLEKKLDDIAEGKRDRVEVLQQFYGPYSKHLKVKEKELTKKELTEEKTDKKCPTCGKPLVIKIGRFGKFLACSGYPDCEYTEKIVNGHVQPEPKPTGEMCPTCGSPLVRRVGRYGPFVGCSDFPTCKYVEQNQTTIDVKCPKCESPMVEKRTKRGRVFWGCSTYPKCDFATWNNPADVPPSMEEYEKNKAKKSKFSKFKKKTKNNKEKSENSESEISSNQ